MNISDPINIILIVIVIFITIIINCNYTSSSNNNDIHNSNGEYITINTTKYPYYHTFWSGFTPYPWMNPTRTPYKYPIYKHNYYHNYAIPYYY
jgi:hypothetical protein